MKNLECLVECDGEILSISLGAEDDNSFVHCYCSGDLDDGVCDWDEFKERYGEKYWPDLEAVFNESKSPTKNTFDGWLAEAKKAKKKKRS
jgi:hypothetical protein